MGVVDLFDKDKADLSHLTHNHIFLNDIRHIANIQVNSYILSRAWVGGYGNPLSA